MADPASSRYEPLNDAFGEFIVFYSHEDRCKKCASSVYTAEKWLQDNVFKLHNVWFRGANHVDVGRNAYQMLGEVRRARHLEIKCDVDWIDLEKKLRKQIEWWSPIVIWHGVNKELREHMPTVNCDLVQEYLLGQRI